MESLLQFEPKPVGVPFAPAIGSWMAESALTIRTQSDAGLDFDNIWEEPGAQVFQYARFTIRTQSCECCSPAGSRKVRVAPAIRTQTRRRTLRPRHRVADGGISPDNSNPIRTLSPRSSLHEETPGCAVSDSRDLQFEPKRPSIPLPAGVTGGESRSCNSNPNRPGRSPAPSDRGWRNRP